MYLILDSIFKWKIIPETEFKDFEIFKFKPPDLYDKDYRRIWIRVSTKQKILLRNSFAFLHEITLFALNFAPFSYQCETRFARNCAFIRNKCFLFGQQGVWIPNKNHIFCMILRINTKKVIFVLRHIAQIYKRFKYIIHKQ